MAERRCLPSGNSKRAHLKSLRAPSVEVAQVSVNSGGAGYWKVGWQVQNTGTDLLRINAVLLPHGQFKAAEQRLDPPLELEPGIAAEFNTLVYCNEPTGLVTENAFIIFAARWREQKWRIFVRLRIVVNAEGQPRSATELVTTQKVGFSGLLDWLDPSEEEQMNRKEKDLYVLQRMRGWHSNWGLGFEETTGMVSNALKTSENEVVEALKRARREQSETPQYKKLRQDLPKEWPI
jgi:hypothetical protein